MSDGAAFNRLLCLSQLCYVMASNTWANTLEMLCAGGTAPKVKMGWGGVNSSLIAGGLPASHGDRLSIRVGMESFSVDCFRLTVI